MNRPRIDGEEGNGPADGDDYTWLQQQERVRIVRATDLRMVDASLEAQIAALHRRLEEDNMRHTSRLDRLEELVAWLAIEAEGEEK